MDRKDRYTFYHVLLYVLFAQIIGFGQSNNTLPLYKFEMLELPNGIRGNHVNVIAQDSIGFMWFGTNSGLIRWDGYQFISFTFEKENANSIASNFVKSIVVGRNGSLWLGFDGGKLDHFDVKTGSFIHYSLSEDPLEKATFNKMVLDFNDNLWIASDRGLHRFNTKNKSFKSFYHNPSDKNSLSFNNCTALTVDSDGTIWVGTGNYLQLGYDNFNGHSVGGLNMYRPETGDFIRYMHDPKDERSLFNDFITELYEDSHGNLWVGMIKGGLQIVNKITRDFTNFPMNSARTNMLSELFENSASEKHISFVFEDYNQKLWLGFWQNGVRNFDPSSGTFHDYYANNKEEDNFIEPFPKLMFQSRDGTIWMTTDNNSARLYKMVQHRIEDFTIPDEGESMVNFISETQDQKIIIATEKGSDLVEYDPNTGGIDVLNQGSKWPFIGKKNSAGEITDIDYKNENLYSWWKIVKDKSGKIWSNIYLRSELFLLDLEKKQIEVYPPEFKTGSLFYNDWVTEVFKDNDDRIWSTTKGGLLQLFDEESDQISSWFFGKDETDSYRAYYSILAQGDQDEIWIAYTLDSEIALKKFDTRAKTFQEFPLVIAPSESKLAHTLTHRILTDKQGFIWVCLDTKLLKIGRETGKTKIYIPSYFGLSRFNNMEFDQRGRMWLFGDNIVLFDTNDESFAKFEIPQVQVKRSSLSQNHETRVFKSSSGSIYFSTAEGIAHFDPLEFGGTGLNHPETHISSYELLFQEATGAEVKNVINEGTVALDYDQNDFAIHFSALNYEGQKSFRYQYLLDGYDDLWRTADVKPKVNYSKVPPGNYRFRVKSSMNGNTWGPESFVRFKISPPIWATWWAYLTYALLLLGGIYSFYKFQLKQRLNKAEANRLKELDSVKTRLYTNITHEFRTPLTVISGMASQIKENPKEWLGEGISMIERNTERLLSLVNQMLDLSKLESGKISLDLQQGDIINFVKYLVGSFQSFGEAKNIRIHFYAKEDEIYMDFDEEKIQQIINNLLSNAVKYTPLNGNVFVNINLLDAKSKNEESDALEIVVRNTGEGISEKDLPFVFDRFYQVDDTDTRSNEGSGIGLSLVKELIQLMRGDIDVKSKKGKDTTFTIELPIERKSSQRINVIPDVIAKDQEADVKDVSLVGDNPKQLENNGKETVLLIEDNADVVAYIASCLYQKYNIKVGTNGQEGIDIALELIPDLIITDVMMPLKNGFEVCDILKNNALTSHIPIVMLTAKADQNSKIQGLETGADAFLVKPFHKEELLVRLKKMLELRKVLQQRYLSILGNEGGEIPILNDAQPYNKANDIFVQQAKNIVIENLSEVSFGVEELCKAMGMSRSHLYRKLMAMVDKSPNNFIQYIRLGKAKQLLLSSEKNVSTISYEIGFNDSSYFSRAFKKEFGMTPGEWRRNIH